MQNKNIISSLTQLTLGEIMEKLSAKRVQLMIDYPHIRRFLKKAPSLNEVREALKSIKGELSKEITAEREEEWR